MNISDNIWNKIFYDNKKVRNLTEHELEQLCKSRIARYICVNEDLIKLKLVLKAFKRLSNYRPMTEDEVKYVRRLKRKYNNHIYYERNCGEIIERVTEYNKNNPDKVNKWNNDYYHRNKKSSYNRDEYESRNYIYPIPNG